MDRTESARIKPLHTGASNMTVGGHTFPMTDILVATQLSVPLLDAIDGMYPSAASIAVIGTFNLKPSGQASIAFGRVCREFSVQVRNSLLAFRRKAYRSGLIIADLDGYFRMSGYEDNIHWLHDLWAFRHGQEYISPVVSVEGYLSFHIDLNGIAQRDGIAQCWLNAEQYHARASNLKATT